MEYGTVKYFSDAKGYGFIKRDWGGDDIFVHQTGIAMDGFRSLAVGDPVEFEVVKSEDGRLRAENVRKLPPQSPALDTTDDE